MVGCKKMHSQDATIGGCFYVLIIVPVVVIGHRKFETSGCGKAPACRVPTQAGALFFCRLNSSVWTRRHPYQSGEWPNAPAGPSTNGHLGGINTRIAARRPRGPRDWLRAWRSTARGSAESSREHLHLDEGRRRSRSMRMISPKPRRDSAQIQESVTPLLRRPL